MPMSCIVVGCGSRSNREKLGFYSVPTITNHKFLSDKNDLSRKRRELWLAAIHRNDLTEKKIKNQRVCSKHFKTGKPASLLDVDNPDWVPSLKMISLSTKERIRRSKRKIPVKKKRSKLAKIRLPEGIDIKDIDESTSGFEVKNIITFLKSLNRKEIEVCLVSQDKTLLTENEIKASSHCQESFEEFSPQSHLEDHSKLQENRRSYQCKICKKTFQRETLLRRHLSYHIQRKLHKCPECKKNFLNDGNLFIHMQRVHSRNCPFKCCMCPMSFSRSSELKVHEITHSDKKTFLCGICSEKFFAEPFLQTHMKEHEREKRRFQCGACDKMLVGREELDTHLREHSNGNWSSVYEDSDEETKPKNPKQFMCTVCFALFSDIEIMKKHFEIHISENPEKFMREAESRQPDTRHFAKNEPQEQDFENINENILVIKENNSETDSTDEDISMALRDAEDMPLRRVRKPWL